MAGMRESIEVNGRSCTWAQGSTQHPYVSILVPVYNASATLAQALGSLARQTFSNIEILLIDDASTDDSPAMLAAFAERDPRASLLTHRANAGYGAAMNDGLALARGEWVGILEPDDYLEPSFVETLLKAVSPHENNGVFPDVAKAAYWRISHENGAEVSTPCAYRGRVKPVGKPFALGARANRNLFQHHPSIWSALYRASFLREGGIRFPEYPGAGWADNEFFYRTLLGARAIVYVDKPLYCYREDSESEELAFFARNPLLPLTRWFALDAIVEDLGVSAEPVLEAHTVRGFDYLDSTVRAGAGSNPQVVELRDAMFARMSPERVFSQTLIPPRMKQLFASVRGLPFDERRAQLLYAHALLGETARMLRYNGPAFFVEHLGRFLKRSDS